MYVCYQEMLLINDKSFSGLDSKIKHFSTIVFVTESESNMYG